MSATRKGGPMAGFRGNGEGSIYQRTSDRRWFGVVTLGQDGTGRVVRKAVSAKTRAEVVRKLKKLQRDLDDGLPAPDTKMTVAQLLTHWHDDVLRHQAVPSTVVARPHIMPRQQETRNPRHCRCRSTPIGEAG